jgi:hypothetical protein
MAMVEGYFDESGDLDTDDKIFSVSGYFLSSEAAKVMDEKWRAVLVEHEIPYFHMVDCAHEPPGGVFVGKSKEERSLIVKKLIALIKGHTLEGISILARAFSYHGPLKDEPNLYSQCAAACAQAMQQFIYTHRIEGSIAYFFESGHKHKGSAYNYIAEKIKRPEDSLTFACKTQVPLLQAADLLAWQSRKYAKDYFYPRVDNKEPTRAARKDFQSLMEHAHTFLHLGIGGKNGMGIELWPMYLRNPNPETISMTMDYMGPVPFWFEEGNPTPITLIEKTLGWRMGGARSAYVTFESAGRKKFTVALDEPRLFEAIQALIGATGVYGDSNIVLTFPAENAIVNEAGGAALLRIKIHQAATVAFYLRPDVLERLRDALKK